MVVKGIERKGKNMKYVTPEMEVLKFEATDMYCGDLGVTSAEGPKNPASGQDAPDCEW